MEESLASLFELSDLKNLSVDSNELSTTIEGTLKGVKSCPKCGSRHLHRQNKNQRPIHLPPIGSKPTKLLVNVQKQYCVDCKTRWWPKIPFTPGEKRMSNAFVSYALELLRFGTIKDVSQHLGIGWDTVKAIHMEYLEKEYECVDISDVKYVSIDEFSIAKRHKYMSTIMDIETGRILYAVEGRKKKDIADCLKDLKKKQPNLKLLQWT